MQIELVVTVDQARALVQKLSTANKVGFDTEVSGPLLVDKKSEMVNVYASTLTGFSVAFPSDNTAYYVPVAHRRGSNCLNWRTILGEVFRDPEREIWAHNWQFDLKALPADFRAQAFKSNLRCSLVAAWLLQWSDELGLKPLAKRILGMEMVSFYDVSKGRSFDDLAPSDAVEYAGKDALATVLLGEYFVPRLQSFDPKLYETFVSLEMPFAKCLADMELAGMGLDPVTLTGLRDRVKPIADDLYEQIYWETGCDPRSPVQLSKWGFGGGHWNPIGIEKGKNGLYKVNADAIASVAESSKPGSMGEKIANLLLEWRAAEKLVSTYTDSMLTKLAQYPDQRIHCEYHHDGTGTGRLSSSYPNLQNIPVRTKLGKMIREAFFSEDPDRVMVSADYSQIELRVLAHLAGPGKLREAYVMDMDIHQQTADLTGTTRDRGKTVNFAVVYGAREKKLAKTLGCTKEEAKSILDNYDKGYPEVFDYSKKVIEVARRRGYVRTLARRFRRIEGIDSSDRMDRWAAERRARNTPVQGGARDIMSKAMVDIWRELPNMGGNPRMIGQIHDDVLFEVHKDFAQDLANMVQEKMTNAWPGLTVPLKTEPTIARVWADMK